MKKLLLLVPLLLFSCVQTFVYKVDTRKDGANSILIGRFAPGVFKRNFFIRKFELKSVDSGKSVISTFRVKDNEFDDFHLFVVDNLPPGEYYVSYVELEQRDVHGSNGFVSWAINKYYFYRVPAEGRFLLRVAPGMVVWAGELRFVTDELAVLSLPDEGRTSVLCSVHHDSGKILLLNGKHPMFVGMKESLLFEKKTLERVRGLIPYYYDWHKMISRRLDAINAQLKAGADRNAPLLPIPSASRSHSVSRPPVDDSGVKEEDAMR